MKAIVLLLSGGIGARVGGSLPKQYIEVNGRMIVSRCIGRVLECGSISGLWIVADESWQEAIAESVP